MTDDEKKFTQADVDRILGDRLKNHVPKADFEALQAEVEALKGYKTKVEELESAGQTEAEKWKRKAEAETKRADAAERKESDRLALLELQRTAKDLVDKRKLREGAYDLIEGMIRPGDDISKIEKEYLPKVEKYFPPANVGGGGRDMTPDLKPNEFNRMVLQAAGRGGR